MPLKNTDIIKREQLTMSEHKMKMAEPQENPTFIFIIEGAAKNAGY